MRPSSTPRHARAALIGQGALRRALGVAGILLTLVLTGACQDQDADQVSVTAGPTASAAPASGSSLEPEEFAAAAKRDGTTILDVRTPQEFAEGHLPGAVNLNVESADFAAEAGTLDPSGTYAVYCHSGNRSGVAMQALTAAGFAEVYDLAGGIEAWQQAGGTLVTD